MGNATTWREIQKGLVHEASSKWTLDEHTQNGL